MFGGFAVVQAPRFVHWHSPVTYSLDGLDNLENKTSHPYGGWDYYHPQNPTRDL